MAYLISLLITILLLSGGFIIGYSIGHFKGWDDCQKKYGELFDE